MNASDRVFHSAGLDWVESTPADWGTPPVGANFEVQLGKMLNPAAVVGDALRPYLRNVNVQWDRVELDDLLLMHFDGADRGRYCLRPGDLLVCEGGEVGRAAVWQGQLEECFYQKALHRVRPYRGDSTRFLMYALMAAASQGVFENEGNTSTIVHLTAEKLRGHRFPWPRPSEQRAIADYLDTETARIDAIVAIREATIPLLWERFWSGVDAAFRGAGRTEALGRYAVSMTDGPFGSSLTSAHYAVGEDGARVIRLGNIGRGVFVPDDRAFIPWPHYHLLRRHEAIPGDLVVAGLGDDSHPLGRACVLPDELGPAIVKADCFRIRLDQERLLPAYVAWFLSSPTGGRLAQELARGSTRQRTNLGLMATIRIPAPSLDRQREVTTQLGGLHQTTVTVADAIRRQTALLLERRQALITAAVTGQVEIPGTAA